MVVGKQVVVSHVERSKMKIPISYGKACRSLELRDSELCSFKQD